MNKLGGYLKRISQEDAASTAVEIKETQGVGSEPEEIKEIDPSCLVDAEPEHDVTKDQIIELTDIKFSLEQYTELLKTSEARGGIRPEEARLLVAGVNFCRKRAGLSSGVGEGVSVEDFGGKMSCLKATRISQEALNVDVKAIAAKIAELIKKLIAKGKEMIASIDLQSTKVGQIVEAVKSNMHKWRTGEMTFETTLNNAISPEDLNTQGLAKLKEAGVFVGALLAAFDTQVSATKRVFMDYAASPERGEVVAYREAMRAIWVDHSPLTSVIKGADSKQLSTLLTYTVKRKESTGSPVLTYSIDVTSNYEQRGKQTITMNKAEFKAVVDATFTLNLQTRKNTQAYASAMANLELLGGIVSKAKGGNLSFALSNDLSMITSLLDIEIAETMREVTRLRTGLGRFILNGGQSFDRSQGTTDVGNDATSNA
ncbi:hypothetical protein D3C85_248760 [compost metagenome]